MVLLPKCQRKDFLALEDRRRCPSNGKFQRSLNDVDGGYGESLLTRKQRFLTDESWAMRDQLLPREYPLC